MKNLKICLKNAISKTLLKAKLILNFKAFLQVIYKNLKYGFLKLKTQMFKNIMQGDFCHSLLNLAPGPVQKYKATEVMFGIY